MTEKTPSRAITFTATGDTLAAVESLAEQKGLALGRAALELVEGRLSGMRVPVAAEPAPADTPRRQMVTLLDQVSVLFLEQLDAADRAAAQPDQSDALAAALARAEAAEAKVAAMQAVLG